MREAYRRVRKDAAAGVDGVTAVQYEADLEANLTGLLERFKSGRYRAPAVRWVHLEKPGTSKTRPIGIPTLEDKILQRAVLMVLEPVYEQDFLECSCCFSLSLVGSPRELAGVFRRRIAWDDGAIREPAGAGAVAFVMNRCCRSGENVGARAPSVGKRWGSVSFSMACPHGP